MECFVIFVMAWCWCNATESKPQNVVFKLMKDNTQKEYQEVKDKLLSELKGLTYRQAKRILDDLQLTIQLKSVVQ